MTEKLSMEAVQLRVHDVRIKGNRKTNDSRDRCAAEGGQGGNKPCKSLSSSRFATIRLRALAGFDKCVVTLDPGPNVLPGTANVIVEVEEAKHPFAGDLGVFSNPEVNYCFLLPYQENDRLKRDFQISLNSPH